MPTISIAQAANGLCMGYQTARDFALKHSTVTQATNGRLQVDEEKLIRACAAEKIFYQPVETSEAPK